MFRFFRFLMGYRRFAALPLAEKQIVFYAEGISCWTHFRSVIETLGQKGQQICYVTSCDADPILSNPPSHIKPFYIGDGMARMLFFETLQADLLIMTMPDLQNLEIKRSKAHPVHYAYLFHSPVSSHMIYRNGAFDHFDSILCVGPHHMEEIRATEALHESKPKQLFPHGYARIDELLELNAKHESPSQSGDAKSILVAPSWGPTGIIETMGERLVGLLLDYGYGVVLRPHPMTKKNDPESLEQIQNKYGEHDRFTYDADVSMTQSLLETDVMISDYSGVALEYAFGLEKPVVFIDVPRKIRNEEYEKVPCVPLEVAIRSTIGTIIAPDDLDRLPSKIKELFSQDVSSTIRNERDKYIFNPGRNGEAGAKAIFEILQRIEQ
jgi:hypothetical protein